MFRPLLLSTALLSGCASLPSTPRTDLERLVGVDLTPKKVYVNYIAAEGTPYAVHEQEIKRRVADFYEKYGIMIEYTVGRELALDTISVEALKFEDYLKQLKQRRGYKVYSSEQGTAIIEQRKVFMSELQYGDFFVFKDCNEEKRIRVTLDGSPQKMAARLVQHEIGHLLGLYHPCSLEDTEVLIENAEGFNLMFHAEVGPEVFLDPIQQRIMHSFLSRGTAHDHFQKSLLRPVPMAWYTENIRGK